MEGGVNLGADKNQLQLSSFPTNKLLLIWYQSLPAFLKLVAMNTFATIRKHKGCKAQPSPTPITNHPDHRSPSPIPDHTDHPH